MGILKGQREFKKWRLGGSLTRKQAILAQCYHCNGEESSSTDCQGIKACPLYQWSPHR